MPKIAPVRQHMVKTDTDLAAKLANTGYAARHGITRACAAADGHISLLGNVC